MDGLPAAGEKNFRPDHEKTSKNLTKPWETESSTISSEVSKTDDQKKTEPWLSELSELSRLM